MAKRVEKKKYTVEEVIEECTRRESDFSDEDVSDAQSYVSSVDSVEEDMFIEGEDIVHDKQTDSDTEWEPSPSSSAHARRSRTTDQPDPPSSSSSEDNPPEDPPEKQERGGGEEEEPAAEAAADRENHLRRGGFMLMSVT